MGFEKESFCIGLMSGTSLDGLDIVYVRFLGLDSYDIVYGDTFSYSKEWLRVLSNISKYSKGSDELLRFDVSLGKYFAELLTDFVNKYSIDRIDFIASHGHTVHHVPNEGYTLQIGSGQEIYNSLSVPVVYNFREQDVFLGGQGAPLVPLGDEFLFKDYDYCLNLGGFSNVSFCENGVRKAFDICPVNTVLNFYAEQLGFDYDDRGVLSSQGNFSVKLFEELNSVSYYSESLPKSLGVEFLKDKIYPILEKYSLSVKDLLRTFVEHIAYQIAKNIKSGKVLVTGGGAYNDYLLERIKKYNAKLSIEVPSGQLVEYKEALIFAYLGKLRIQNKVNCLSSVTGASCDHSTGMIII